MAEREQQDEQQAQDEPLRESEVTSGDRLDDRVQEGEGLADDDQNGDGDAA